jgi:hypothetical protein
MTTAKDQLATFYRQSRNIAEANTLFLELVKEGMTREELQHNIARRPALWGRWAGFLDKLPSRTPITDKPLAAPGLTSYRCKGSFGWIMIGAHDHADAMRQARRSSDSVQEKDLEVWDGSKYVPVNLEKCDVAHS